MLMYVPYSKFNKCTINMIPLLEQIPYEGRGDCCHGLLSHAAVFNPWRIKSIVLPHFASIENSSKSG
jgi:hypothetical protein